MGKWTDFRGMVKEHFVFNHEEIRLLILYILVLGFVVGFNDGSEVFRLTHWLRNFLNSLVIVSLTLLAAVSAQKMAGLHYGQNVEFKLWTPGLLIAVFFALFTNGEWLVLFSGGIVAHMMKHARIGKFRYGFSYNDLGKIAAAGPLANVGLAILLKMLLFLPGGGLLEKAIIINLLFAIFNMLPIPPLAGSMVLFASRSWYVFTFAGIGAITALLLLTSSILWAILGSLAVGFAVFMIYFVMLETKN